MIIRGGGGTQLFFDGCVPRGFQNEGSRERIFLEKWESCERKFWEIWVKRARILAKNMAENAKIFSKLKTGVTRAAHWRFFGRLGSGDWPEKRGSWPRHIPIPLSNVSAPRDDYIDHNAEWLPFLKCRCAYAAFYFSPFNDWIQTNA